MALILVVFFSYTGNTRTVANYIHQMLGGDIFELVPENPYTKSWPELIGIARNELVNKYLPPLKEDLTNATLYDMIFIGSPIWWAEMASPVQTFLSKNNIEGKTIYPFCAHRGGGPNEFPKQIRESQPGSYVMKEFDIAHDEMATAEAKVAVWLQSHGLKTRTKDDEL
jgi:flavodoxin